MVVQGGFRMKNNKIGKVVLPSKTKEDEYDAVLTRQEYNKLKRERNILKKAPKGNFGKIKRLEVEMRLLKGLGKLFKRLEESE